MKQQWLDTTLELLRLPTAPTREDAVAEWLADWASRQNLDVCRDRWGNMLLAYRRGKPTESPIALCAHMDHPGFVAGETRDDARLRARWMGACPPELFMGAQVRFCSRGGWVKGRIVHVPEGKKMGDAFDVLVEPAGAVDPGSAGMWDFPDPWVEGQRIYARGHDDISGVAAIVCALDEARRRKIEGEVRVLFTRCEEFGLLGAIGACKSRTLAKRSVVVALETSRAKPEAPIGGGVVVRVGDKASVFTPWVSAMLSQAAEAVGKKDGDFKWQRRLMDGGTCESSVYCAYGFDAGGLCLPLGNYHNVDWDRGKLDAEYINTGDFASLVKLLLDLIRRGAAPGDPKERWERLFEERSHVL